MLNVPYIVHRYVYCSCTVLAMIIAVIIDRTDHYNSQCRQTFGGVRSRDGRLQSHKVSLVMVRDSVKILLIISFKKISSAVFPVSSFICLPFHFGENISSLNLFSSSFLFLFSLFLCLSLSFSFSSLPLPLFFFTCALFRRYLFSVSCLTLLFYHFFSSSFLFSFFKFFLNFSSSPFFLPSFGPS